jgi:hypothetical protein
VELRGGAGLGALCSAVCSVLCCAWCAAFPSWVVLILRLRRVSERNGLEACVRAQVGSGEGKRGVAITVV